ASAGFEAKAQQTEEIEQYLVVEGDNVVLRCCPWSFGYPVGELDSGEVLFADERADTMFRVRYPEGTPALVEVEDVDYSAATGKVKLRNASRLLAHNVSDTAPQSWKSLLSTPLPAGTELTVQKEVRNSDGRVTGYLVDAPKGARGYVDAQFVREATEQETRAYRVARGEIAATTERETAAADAASNQAAEGSQQTEVAQATPAEGDDESVETVAASQERTPRSTQGDGGMAAQNRGQGTTGAMTPSETQVAQASDGDAPATDGAGGADASQEEAAAEDRPAPTLAELDASFEEVMKAPVEDAEVMPLIGEYEAMLSATPDTEFDQSMRKYLRGKIELLRIRKELQDSMRRLASLEDRAQQTSEEIRTSVRGLDRRHEFLAVGRLTTSSLYNGRRLPLMYRLVSMGPEGQRTVAYLAPSDEVDLSGRLGQVVGVTGSRIADSNLRLNVIRPTQLHTLAIAPE
ncbi:MAG: hypothetical protein VYC34_08330, partial [Planctomycetota bacterium]|nr:hypothetical protein [Planctomycetota bacterium]